MFWVFASALAAGVAALLALALLRGGDKVTDAAAVDVEVYRDQLAEVERDLARGVMAEDDAERARVEISRRLLAADARANAAGAEAKAQGPVVALIGLAVIVALAFVLYARMGAPGYGDLGLKLRKAAAAELHSTRPSQSEQEAKMPAFEVPETVDPTYLELVTRLREAAGGRDDDLKGQELLVRHEGALGNYAAAHRAQAKVVAIKGDQAGLQDHLTHAGLMIQAADGYISPEAEAALLQVLKADPRNGPARYYLGQMQAQVGRPDIAFRMWRQLLEESTAQAPWVPLIRAEIGTLAQLAGVDYTPPALPGPTQEDMQAAQDLSAEDRQAMIEGMVEQLGERLATEGGSAAEWARLINALGVLGQTERAQAIYDEAQSVFAEDQTGLNAIHAAAAAAGLQ